MNQSGARRAVVKLIDDYKDVLLYNIRHQGQQRELDVYKSVLTAPRRYYHVVVQIDEGRTASYSSRTTESKPHRAGRYSCTVHFVDAALSQGVDVEPYEQMDEDFRELVDRFEALLSGSYHAGLGTYAAYFSGLPVCIPDPSTESKFRLPREGADRVIRVVNLDHTWVDPNNEVEVPLLVSQVTFELEETWQR